MVFAVTCTAGRAFCRPVLALETVVTLVADDVAKCNHRLVACGGALSLTAWIKVRQARWAAAPQHERGEACRAVDRPIPLRHPDRPRR